MKRILNITIGLLFIIPGVLYLLKTMGIIDYALYLNLNLIKNYWPIIIFIIPAIIMHIGAFSSKNKDTGSLIYAGIFVGIGLTLQISHSYDLWAKMWPGYIFAIALGLLESFIFGKKEKGTLIASSILTGVSSIFFFKNFYSLDYKGYILPAILIITGMIIIFGGNFKKR